MTATKTYLALGDSMSIDDYTGVEGGGAVNQFFRSLGEDWTLDDRTFDGCQMAGVPRDGRGELITLTIGGNDLLWNRETYLRDGVDRFASEHAELLSDVRDANPDATFIVGDIYAPAASISDVETNTLADANAAIHSNCAKVGALVARIHAAFLGREETLLCLDSPRSRAREVIAELFREAFQRAADRE